MNQVNFTRQEMQKIEEYIYIVNEEDGEVVLDIGREMNSEEVAFVVSVMSHEIDNVLDKERVQRWLNSVNIADTKDPYSSIRRSETQETFKVGRPTWVKYLEAIEAIKMWQFRFLIMLYVWLFTLTFLISYWI